MEALNKKTVEDLDVNGKKVLVRCDFNVPLKDGVITSDKRIVASLPTIKYLIDHNAKVILCSHLGRPKGEFNPEFSLAPVAVRLSELLGKEVKMAKDVVGESAQSIAASLNDGDVMLLENHGALAVGSDVITAFYRMESLELWAKITINAVILGGSHDISPENIQKLIDLRGYYRVTGRHPGYKVFNPDDEVLHKKEED